MMKKLLVIVTSAVILLFNLISSLPVSAYTTAPSFYTSTIAVGSTKSFTFTNDGVLLLHSFFKTSNTVDAFLPSERNLDLTYFTSGTWQGASISELSSNKICDQSDTVGFSQTVSVTSDSKWFIYSVVTCLPCVSGDSFTIKQASSRYAYETGYFTSTSVLYGVSSVKKVYNYQRGSYTSDPLSYTTKSDRQYLIAVYSSDKFSPERSWGDILSVHSDDLCLDYSNITRIGSSFYASVYTSNFGLSSGVDLSLYLKDNIQSWNFSVYEIYTDGTFHPGYDDGSDPDSSGGSGSGGIGDITVNVDMTETNSKLDTLISAVKALPAEIWDCFKIGIGFTDSDSDSGDSSSGGSSGGSSSLLPPSDSDLDIDLDPDEVGSTLDSISDDFGVSGTLYFRLRGSFHFFWKFTDNFFLSTELYGIVGVSLILALVIWLLNR